MFKDAKIFMTACAMALALTGTAHAEFPERPIHMIVGYPPGGGSDLLARVIGDHLASNLGQPVVVENKPGAGTTLAANLLVKSKPDGYTLLQTSLALATAEKVIGPQAWSYSEDLKSVAPLGITDFLLVVPANSEIKTFEDLVAAGKTKDLNYSSSGIGAPSHLIVEDLADRLGLSVSHIPYEGAGPAFNALLAGEVDMGFAVTMTAIPMIADGKLRAIAVSTVARSPLAPDVPSLHELGVKDFSGVAWYGLVAPKDTPDEIVTSLNSAVNKALSDPAVQAKLLPMGFTLETGSPQALQEFSAKEIARWTAILEKTKK